MVLGREILSSDKFEEYKSRIDSAQSVEDLAEVIASVPEQDREHMMVAAKRRLDLMLIRRIEKILESKN